MSQDDGQQDCFFASTGLPEGCPVYSAGNDRAAGAPAAELERDGGALITLGSAQMVYHWSKELAPPEEGIIHGVYSGGGTCRMVAGIYGGNQILRTIKPLNLGGFDAFFDLAEEGFSTEAILSDVYPSTSPELNGGLAGRIP